MHKDIHRQLWFDNQAHQQVWKDNMSGKNEERCLTVLGWLGYELGKDFVRQHPILETRVVDFCFINEKVVIEIDGKNHESKEQIKKDRKTDAFLRNNGWAVLRIKENEMFGEKGSFWKNMIKEVVEERRKEYLDGLLFEIETKKSFNQEDYF